jgi:hypothetical protein
MTGLPALMAAHQDFSWDGPAPGTGQPALLPRPRFVHAVLVEAPGPKSPWFQDYVRAGSPWRALCGTEVLVVTTSFFDEAARGACKRCAGAVERWLDDESLINWDWVVHDRKTPAGLP